MVAVHTDQSAWTLDLSCAGHSTYDTEKELNTFDWQEGNLTAQKQHWLQITPLWSHLPKKELIVEIQERVFCRIWRYRCSWPLEQLGSRRGHFCPHSPSTSLCASVHFFSFCKLFCGVFLVPSTSVVEHISLSILLSLPVLGLFPKLNYLIHPTMSSAHLWNRQLKSWGLSHIIKL